MIWLVGLLCERTVLYGTSIETLSSPAAFMTVGWTPHIVVINTRLHGVPLHNTG